MYANLSLKQICETNYAATLYPTQVATSISSYISAFLPYEQNFPGIRCVIPRPNSTPAPNPMSLDITLKVRSSSAATQGSPLMIRVMFPTKFPNESAKVLLLVVDRNLKVKQPYPVMGNDGSIQLECLTFLRGTERPYPLIDILVALTEQFELEYPLVDHNYRPPQPSNSKGSVAAVLNHSGSDPRRNQMVQDAAEKVVIDLNEKASGYLQTRQDALEYLKRLNEANRDLVKAEGLLEKHKTELKNYLPNVGNVQMLVKSLESYQDDIQSHSNCLVAEDPIHAKALDLMAELHASEDTLRLLEDGLKAEQLNCEEFVKCVSDVGREQFMTRFLWMRVCDALPQLASIPTMSDGTAPSIPQRLSSQEALSKEFPNAPPDVIADVLRNTNNDVNQSRIQLKNLFS